MTEIPNTIGNYKIERQLGEGGMADVYLATHLLMNRQFAVKIMKPEICAKDPMGTKRFVREAQLAQKVHHPNVVLRSPGFGGGSGSPHLRCHTPVSQLTWLSGFHLPKGH